MSIPSLDVGGSKRPTCGSAPGGPSSPHDSRDVVLSRYAPMIKSVALRYLCDGVAVEDLVQEGSLGLLAALDRYDSAACAQFSTYAYHFIHGRIRHYVRDYASLIRVPARQQERGAQIYPVLRFSAEFASESSDGIVEDHLPDPAANFAEAFQDGLVLREAVVLLPSHERKVLLAYYFDEMTLEEIARTHGISRQTASKRLRRGIDLLQQMYR